MIYETQNSAQMKIIKELQKSVQVLQLSQSQLLMHINILEDIVIALSNSENDLVRYKKAQKVAK